jgi:hypothetical protein
MDLYQTQFELDAIKAYFEDPWTSSDDEGSDDAISKEGGQVDISTDRSSKVSDV